MPAPCRRATTIAASLALIDAAQRRIEACRTHMRKISEHNLQRTADTLESTNQLVNESLMLLMAPRPVLLRRGSIADRLPADQRI
jgi:hypothetical protein